MRARLTAVLLTALLAAGCSSSITTTETAGAEQAPPTTTTTLGCCTPEQAHWLAVQAWQAAERAAFLQAVAQVRDAVPGELRSIRWCEAGAYKALPFPQTNYTAMTHGYDGASGGYQMVGTTYLAWARAVGVDVDRWPRAFLAPDWVQDQVATWGYVHSGKQHWNPSRRCWG